jgi:hypothetical protein
MASQAHSTGDSISVAKLGLFGTIGGAIITAVTTLVVNHSNHTEAITNESKSTSSVEAPPGGLSFSPVTNGTLTVSGSAQKDVNGMYVVIGPKPSGRYDTGYGPVVNQRWQAEVPTDPSWQQYSVVTIPYYGSTADAARPSAYRFTVQGFDPTTTPPAPPDQKLNCAAQQGPSCLTGPGFGPPSTYQPDH